MKAIKTFGHIRNGKLHIDKRKQVNEAISLSEDCQIKVVISKLYGKRSTEQNGYYWGVIVNIWQDIMIEATGEHFNIDEMHEFLKQNFNSEDVVCENTGMILRKIKSTTKNTTVDQEDYHQKCRDAAWENFNVEIPLPSKQIEIDFKKDDK